MSALDDLIARDANAPAQPSNIDSLISRDQGMGAPASPASVSSAGNWKAPNSFGMGILDPIAGGVQSIVHGLSWAADKIAPNSQFAKDFRAAAPQVDQTIAQHEQAYQQARQAAQSQNFSNSLGIPSSPPGIDWGRIGGNLLGAAPLAFNAPETATSGLLGRMLIGAGTGAASTALQPVTDATQPYAAQKAAQVGIGAATGGVAAPLTAALGGIVGGAGNAAQQRLSQAGVNMTPGQILGGAWARTEDKLTSVPILGDFIKNAQQRSVQSFNRATYNEALSPIGATLPGNVSVGSDAVAAVRSQIGHVYDSIEPRATFVPDQNFNTDLAGIRANLAQTAPSMLNQFDNIVGNQITGKAASNGGALTGAQWGNTRAEINAIARNQTLGNATPDNRSLADALGQLNDAVNAGVARSSPSDILPTLQSANAAWARYKQIEAAAGSAGASNNGNVFTAAQFTNAVRRGSTAAQKSTNSGLSGQLGADAQEVLGSQYPNSGTPGRAALMAALGALGGQAVLPAGIAIPATIGGAAAALPYTALGQRLGQTLLMSRPSGAAQVGRMIGNYGVPLGAALGATLSNGANR